ncbi:MAG TPA: hypothetical protein VMU48_16300 [Terracidiphilus sp.]|nr:hypothetical protein [Terracidiphilus sp.]
MSATSTPVPAVRTTSSAPSPFSPNLSHGLLGILGVLLGAAIVTITGRLPSLGKAGLRGNDRGGEGNY